MSYAGGEFLAFTNDAESTATLKQFAASKGWPETSIMQGDAATAATHLAAHPSPAVLMIDVPSAEEAKGMLDKLADVCEPGVKVIVSGKINEYSFYCWLVEIGIAAYALKPLTLPSLEAAWVKATQPPAGTAGEAAKKEAKIITLLGTRGGVGATTIAVNLAWILANHRKQKVALLDLDPHVGTVALTLDLEPGRGLRDALEKPDRIDGLFLERVMVRFNEYLSILSAEEPLEERVMANELAAEALIREVKTRFTHVVIDLPRELNGFGREILKRSDHVLVITETTMPGLRDSLRLFDLFRDALKIKPPMFIASREGVAGKHHMPKGEFKKGLGAEIAHTIPFVQDAYTSANTGEIMVDKVKNEPLIKELNAIADHFCPPPKGKGPQAAQPAKSGGIMGFLKG